MAQPEKRIKLIPLLALLVLLPPSEVRPQPGSSSATHKAPRTWCGTHRHGHTVRQAFHRDHLRRLARASAAAAPDVPGRSLPAVTKVGDVAVIEDDGTLVSEPSEFDLSGQGINFKRRKNNLRAVRSTVPVKDDLGSLVEIQDDDSVLIEFPSFDFPFFGTRYEHVFLNSDGNLTFVEADNASMTRSLGRFLNGPPRIAPLFIDLDPSQATTGGVYLRTTSTSMQITWSSVPEFGSTNENTVQVTLFRSGRILVAYGSVDAVDAVVGVAPGGGGGLALIDFDADLPVDSGDRALAERFSAEEQIDDLGIAQTFFRHFADEYDHLIVWLDFPAPAALDGAFAFELNIKNQVEGIGLDPFDFSRSYGSEGRLESYVQMGFLTKYPEDPDRNIRPLTTFSTMDLLGQEVGHRWLAYVRFRDQGGAINSDLLGRDFQHWSFFFDSDASVMEGNDIGDNGNGTFTTVGATERYSPLDRYLMGLIPRTRVGKFFYVKDARGSGVQRVDDPRIGITFAGDRVDLGVGDVIAAEGQRTPRSKKAPKEFNMAFILMGRAGEPPSKASIDKVNKIRKRWGPYFRKASVNGTVKTNLVEKS